jgi:hypothetical protein
MDIMKFIRISEGGLWDKPEQEDSVTYSETKSGKEEEIGAFTSTDLYRMEGML